MTACAVCHDLRYVRLDVPASDPRWGKALPCPLCEEPRLRRLRAERLRSLAGVPGDLSAYTFANYRPDAAVGDARARAGLARSLQVCEGYADSPAGWLVLCGPPGIGKTHLAYAIVGRRLELGGAVYYGSWPEMLDTLRGGYQDGAAMDYDTRMQTLLGVDLLVLDDLGSENVTAWSNEKLFELVNHRYTRRLPLVVTSNLRVTDPTCAIEPRVRSRLNDTRLGQVVVMAAGDYRGKGGT